MASNLALLIRPYNITTDSGTCIDNIFIKISSINAKTFKLMTLTRKKISGTPTTTAAGAVAP